MHQEKYVSLSCLNQEFSPFSLLLFQTNYVFMWIYYKGQLQQREYSMGKVDLKCPGWALSFVLIKQCISDNIVLFGIPISWRFFYNLFFLWYMSAIFPFGSFLSHPSLTCWTPIIDLFLCKKMRGQELMIKIQDHLISDLVRTYYSIIDVIQTFDCFPYSIQLINVRCRNTIVFFN